MTVKDVPRSKKHNREILCTVESIDEYYVTLSSFPNSSLEMSIGVTTVK